MGIQFKQQQSQATKNWHINNTRVGSDQWYSYIMTDIDMHWHAMIHTLPKTLLYPLYQLPILYR